MDCRRVAVLVDGDNVSPAHSSRILTEAKKMGRVDIARVYCAGNCASGWLTASGYRLMHAGEGKNSTDLLLSIDAMELALAGGIQGVVIASSDCDYLHLAQRLREHAIPVLGLGEQKAPEKYRASCSWFCLLENETTGPEPPIKPQAKTAKKPNGNGVTEFDRKIRSMIAQHSENGRGMLVSVLAPKMHSAHGTRISTFPERNWRAYLSARPTLFEIDPRGPEAMVRFLPAGFAQ